MTFGLLTFVACIYIITAGAYLGGEGRPGMALAFVGYAIGNIGLIWDLYR